MVRPASSERHASTTAALSAAWLARPGPASLSHQPGAITCRGLPTVVTAVDARSGDDTASVVTAVPCRGFPTFVAAVDAWYVEVGIYNFTNPGWHHETGHFTQVGRLRQGAAAAASWCGSCGLHPGWAATTGPSAIWLLMRCHAEHPDASVALSMTRGTCQAPPPPFPSTCPQPAPRCAPARPPCNRSWCGATPRTWGALSIGHALGTHSSASTVHQV